MAQRRQLTWTELRVGIFALLGLLVLALGIFYVTGAGSLGPKVQLMTYMPEVDGLATGAPVRLAGVDIGTVQSLSLTPHPQDPMHNVTVVMRVNRKFESDIRTDSLASLITEGVLGTEYVSITRGLTGEEIPPNGTVPSKTETGIKELVDQSTALMNNLTGVTNNLKSVVQDIQNGEGTVGKLIIDPSLYNHLNDAVGKVDSMVASAQEGNGTLGKLVASDDLYNKADATIGHVDDVVVALKDQNGTAGKLIYDPALYNNVNAMLQDVRDGKGTLGKLVTDDALYTNMRDTTANLRDATAKMNSNQGTIGKLFTDPKLYDNLTGLTGDLRLMVGDFRKNPKKFLHLKLSIF